ncbi:MAG: glycosyl transferase [Planctomycetota bacterium]|nr:MAG: glycosyl transferase [Planctomycetota bacterium]
MRIAYVSTFPPIECGIATYTQFLSEAMARQDNEIHIVSEDGAQGHNVYPAYTKESGSLSKDIFDMSVKVTPDVVHIQHEFGLFGATCGISVLDLIYRYRASNTPVVATFHTVLPDPNHVQLMIMSVMCKELSAVIVHEQSHFQYLIDVYGADKSKINLIPHGAREMPLVPDAKEKLGFKGKKVVLLAGYFRPTKGFDRMVELFPRVVEKVPEALLVLSGKMRLLEYGEYRNQLFELISNSPVKDNIEVLRGQFPQHTFDTILSSSDIMLFPYTAGAQSGVMAHAMTFGKPVVTSQLPAFHNIVEKADIGFSATTDDEYVDAIVKLLTDDECFQKYTLNALNYVKNTISWDVIANKTLEIYSSFNPGHKCSTRYVYFG